MVKESELVEGLHERAKMIVGNRARRLPTNIFAIPSLASLAIIFVGPTAAKFMSDNHDYIQSYSPLWPA